MRLSSPSCRTIRSTAKSSPSSERSSSAGLPSSNLSYNSATLPSSRKIRAPASPPTSTTIDFTRRLSSITCKSKGEGSSSPNTPGHQASQQKPSSSSTNNVCDVCSSYGHPWIEICKAIRATKGIFTHVGPFEIRYLQIATSQNGVSRVCGRTYGLTQVIYPK